MTLKLPKPLPYDFVDQMIEENYVFVTEPAWSDGKDEDEDEADLIRWSVHRLDPITGKPNGTSNWGRDMFELIEDYYEHESKYEDEEGYLREVYFDSGMHWVPEELTDEQIDRFLGLNQDEDENE